jgi:hypothetical protein
LVANKGCASRKGVRRHGYYPGDMCFTRIILAKVLPDARLLSYGSEVVALHLQGQVKRHAG